MVSLVKLFHCRDDTLLVRPTQPIPHRQPSQPFTLGRCKSIFSVKAPELLTSFGGVQRYVMKNGHNVFGLQVRKQRCPFFDVRGFEVEHVGIVCAALRNDWKAYFVGFLKGQQGFIVALPNREAAFVDIIDSFKLAPQVCGL